MSRSLIATLLLVSLFCSGCVYKLSVFQGNPVSADDVAQVEVGMTRSQVQFLLGTPLIEDPFHSERWDYIYYYRDGKSGNEFKRRFEVHFIDGKVSEVKDLSS
ncbi:MAG: outer membrane protein assembly factor BamE [Gammaproteobacteria bacterium]|nr:outer membrane protein assembly factor BamE [Gammaproteobacteria bacterium]